MSKFNFFYSVFIIVLFFTLNDVCAKSIADLSRIEIQTQACLDKGISMPNCNYTAISMYKKEIENLLKKLKVVLTQSQYKKIIKVQDDWEQFANNNIGLYEDIFDIVPARDVQLFGSEFKKNMYKNRCVELMELYSEYIFIAKQYKAKDYYK